MAGVMALLGAVTSGEVALQAQSQQESKIEVRQDKTTFDKEEVDSAAKFLDEIFAMVEDENKTFGKYKEEIHARIEGFALLLKLHFPDLASARGEVSHEEFLRAEALLEFALESRTVRNFGKNGTLDSGGLSRATSTGPGASFSSLVLRGILAGDIEKMPVAVLPTPELAAEMAEYAIAEAGQDKEEIAKQLDRRILLIRREVDAMRQKGYIAVKLENIQKNLEDLRAAMK